MLCPKTEAAFQPQQAFIMQKGRSTAAKCDFSKELGDPDFNVKLSYFLKLMLLKNFRAKHIITMNYPQLMGRLLVISDLIIS